MLCALAVVAAASIIGCAEERPDPLFVAGPETDGDGDGDADVEYPQPDETDTCTGDVYPCGPYGNTRCDTIADLGFVAANDAAVALAGDDGVLNLSDVFADESVVGVLLFGTAGWCPVCSTERDYLNTIYEEFQDVDGEGHRVEFIAVVFQNDAGAPATSRYAASYAERGGITFPTVADTRGDILYYFDAQSAPGNIFVDATLMRIQKIEQGFDGGGIEGDLYQLDGETSCR
jgi:peroxiredoxin